MEQHRFGKKSQAIMLELEEGLQRLLPLALKYSPYDFGLTEGLRTLERQKELLAKGKSKTLKSRHLPNENELSEAVDIIIYDENGKPTYQQGYYRKVAQAFYRAAIELNIQIEWGGFWKSFFDGPHYQLARGLK